MLPSHRTKRKIVMSRMQKTIDIKEKIKEWIQMYSGKLYKNVLKLIF